MEKAKKTKTGGYTTSEEVLEKLRDKHPVVGKILDYRGVKKLLSTYIEALPDLRLPRWEDPYVLQPDHRRHGPPLQQQPQHPEYPHPHARGSCHPRGLRTRCRLYLPQRRLLADRAASDGTLQRRSRPHRGLPLGARRPSGYRSEIYGLSPEEVTPDMRRRAKTANFGIIYGISAFGLSERLSIPRKEAKELIDGYFASYPGVANYMSTRRRGSQAPWLRDDPPRPSS